MVFCVGVKVLSIAFQQFTKTPTSSLPAAQQQTNSVCEQTTEIQNETKSKAKSQAKKSTNLKCLICKTTFEKVSLYRKHVLEHRNAKKFKCAECSASYNIEDNYKLHMAIHSKGPPCCPLCDRKFQRHASLKAHLIVHEVDETIACIKCLAEFDREEDLNSHMEVHKREEAAIGSSKTPLPLICSYCNYTFDDPKAYKEHVSYHVKVKKRRL